MYKIVLNLFDAEDTSNKDKTVSYKYTKYQFSCNNFQKSVVPESIGVSPELFGLKRKQFQDVKIKLHNFKLFDIITIFTPNFVI